MRIAFIWSGVSFRYGKRFKDGLWAALEILKESHTIGRFEPDNTAGIIGFKPDVLLFWGAFIDQEKGWVTQLPYKKAICFAGGPIDAEVSKGFDLYFTESQVTDDAFKNLNLPYFRAFGVNEKLYQPQNLPKKYDAAFWGTFAAWKRPQVFSEAVKDKGVWVGIKQAHEPECYEVCEQDGVETHGELSREETLYYINSSYTALNTAAYWGGGQRMTLEAMSCNVPPIVMADSPKNTEYVLESGVGLVVEPHVEKIQAAILKLKGKQEGREYILSKWTAAHYAKSLEKGLMSL